jgi:hypothetical protein
MDVVEKVQYDSAFTFIYSKRTGTPAATMENQVPEEVVKERFDRLLERVQQIAAVHAGKDVGKVVEVLVEEQNGQDASLMTGRTSQNYVVHFPGETCLIGKIIPVKLIESKGFYWLENPCGRNRPRFNDYSSLIQYNGDVKEWQEAEKRIFRNPLIFVKSNVMNKIKQHPNNCPPGHLISISHGGHGHWDGDGCCNLSPTASISFIIPFC